MTRPSQYPLELRRRAVRMVAEVRPEYCSAWTGGRTDPGHAAFHQMRPP